MPISLRKFQNILLMTAALALVTTAKKSQANNPFPRGSGVIFNAPKDQFDEQIKETDKLMLLYVFDSAQDKSSQMSDQILIPLMDELKGYYVTYAYDCQEQFVKESGRFKMCDNPDHTPFFQLMKPPAMKINPYTKLPMGPDMIPFSDNQVTQQKVKSFLLQHLPDYAVNITTPAQMKEFLSAKDDQDINRVILFSKKAKTPPIYKVLTALYRDKIRFGFVTADNKEVVSQFTNVTDFPTLLVLKTYDPLTKSVVPVEEIKYGKKDYKVDELKEFVEPFVREGKKEDLSKQESKKSDDEESVSSKRDKRKKPYLELYSERHFNTHILDNEKACLVFFITGTNVTAEVPLFDRVFKHAYGPLSIAVYYLNNSASDFAEVKKKYKLQGKFPQMRFYKNNIFGEEKNQKSFEIYTNTKMENIIEELHEGIDFDMKEMSEKILNNMAVNYAVEQKKNVIIYFYNEGRISLHVKALSTLAILKDDFAFLAVSSPSDSVLEGFQVKAVPGIAGIIAANPGEEQDAVKQFYYGGRIEYDEILSNLLQLSGKQEEYQQQQKARKKSVDRKFEEITSQAKFQQYCVDKQKGCAIAFLSGNTILDYEKKNHQEYTAILEQQEKEAATMPLYYMWINATCHSYLLSTFDVNPMFVPTVVFYLPGKDKSAHMIGKFDRATIQKHEQKFVNGKLATFAMKTKASDIVIQDLDCPNMQPEAATEEGNVDKEIEDEILQEILLEEEERKKQKILVKGDGKRGGTKKAKKETKKKSGKKKSASKEEL